MVVHENAPRHRLSTRLPAEALLLNSEAHRQWRDLHYAADAGQDRFMTLIVTHPACLGHQMGDGRPDRPASDDDDLALAALVAAKTTVAAALTKIGGLDIAAEIVAVDLRDLAFAADCAALHFLRHRFAELVAENECGLVRRTKIAREGERRFAFDLVAEDRDGREIGAERELMRCKERPAGHREITFAGPATKAQSAVRAPTVIGV